MKIQVLGPGCAKCKQLAANVEKVVAELGIDALVEKVEDVREDVREIMKFRVLSTPALVIDGTVKSLGRVLKPEAIKDLLRA